MPHGITATYLFSTFKTIRAYMLPLRFIFNMLRFLFSARRRRGSGVTLEYQFSHRLYRLFLSASMLGCSQILFACK